MAPPSRRSAGTDASSFNSPSLSIALQIATARSPSTIQVASVPIMVRPRWAPRPTPGLNHAGQLDAEIMFLRFRHAPDPLDQMDTIGTLYFPELIVECFGFRQARHAEKSIILELIPFPVELTHDGGLPSHCLAADTLGRNVPQPDSSDPNPGSPRWYLRRNTNEIGSDRDPKSVLAHKGDFYENPKTASPSRRSQSTTAGCTVRLPYVATSDLANSPVIAYAFESTSAS
jgi:hypothetical protein